MIFGTEAQNLSKTLSKSIKNRSKIDQKSIKNRSWGVLGPIWGGLGAHLGGSWDPRALKTSKSSKKYPQGPSFGGGFGAMLGSKIEKIASWTHAKRRSTWKSIFYRFWTLLDLHFWRFLRSFWRPKSIKNQLFYRRAEIVKICTPSTRNTQKLRSETFKNHQKIIKKRYKNRSILEHRKKSDFGRLRSFILDDFRTILEVKLALC